MEVEEKPTEGAAAAKRAPRSGDKPKKAAPALKLDDAASWPAVGAAAGAPNGAAKAGHSEEAGAELAAEVEEEEEQAPDDEAAEAPPVAAKAAAPAVGVALSESGGVVSLSITHSDE